MAEKCGCGPAGKPVQYQCSTCGDDCCIIEFDQVPNTEPYCCGAAMKRIK